ncbi:MAG: DUF1207 domain-containing protein [Marinicella sp.]
MLLIIILTLLPLSITQAAQDNHLLTTQLKHCQSIADNQLRLNCYDQINQQTDDIKESEVKGHKTGQFPNLIADLDEANLYISYGKLDFLGRDFNAVLFGGGVRQSVQTFQWAEHKPLTFNVFGQIRSQFDVSELDTRNNRGGALINTDFSVGGELVQSLDHWNWRLSYTHRSTHLGDEFIIDNQNYLEERLNLSYETVKWTVHKPVNHWDLYAGVGLVTRSEPGNLDKVMWQLGWQYAGSKWHGFKPVLGVDLKSWGAYDWNINANIRAGVEIDQWTDKPFQLLFEYQDGHSPYGQFYNEDLTFTGLTFLQNW